MKDNCKTYLCGQKDFNKTSVQTSTMLYSQTVKRSVPRQQASLTPTRNIHFDSWPLSPTQYKTTLFLAIFPSKLFLQTALIGGSITVTFPNGKLDDHLDCFLLHYLSFIDLFFSLLSLISQCLFLSTTTRLRQAFVILIYAIQKNSYPSVTH